MKKNFIFVALLCFMLFMLFNTAYAISGSFLNMVMGLFAKNFGGTITETEVEDIKEWKNEGYTCTPDGKYITVKSKTGTANYFISSSVNNEKRNGIMSKNKQILGKYSGTKKIECTKEEDTQSINLNRVTYFGT